MLVPLPRPLKLGDKGLDVLMVKRAISRAGYRKWGFGFSQSFGSMLEKNIRQFQAASKLVADGEYGPKTHAKLASYFDAYGANTMLTLWKAEQATPIDIAVKVNLTAYNYAWQNAYSQGSGRMQMVREGIKTLAALVGFYKAGRTLVEDCSSFQTGAAQIGGLVNPNTGAKVFTQDGYTGTMTVHGRRISTPVKGALGFYGNAWPYKHVVRALEDGANPKVGSHGGPGFHIEPWNYRGDFSHWRVYD